jgi:Arc/MetJ-type ribon-helix-helix transcriptional regulator
MNSRSKLISVRLTEEEYEQLRHLCDCQGLRTVSEIARAGITILLQEPERVSAESLSARVTSLETRMQLLAREMKRLSRTLPKRG